MGRQWMKAGGSERAIGNTTIRSGMAENMTEVSRSRGQQRLWEVGLDEEGKEAKRFKRASGGVTSRNRKACMRKRAR